MWGRVSEHCSPLIHVANVSAVLPPSHTAIPSGVFILPRSLLSLNLYDVSSVDGKMLSCGPHHIFLLSFHNAGCSILIMFAVLNASRLFFPERQREFCYGDTHVWNSTYQATVRLVETETVSFAVELQQRQQRLTSACLS